MQVTETLNDGLKRGYTITVTAGELETKVNEKLEEHRANFQMKGFRKGKAPLALMKKMFGKSVLGEAMQETIDSALTAHLQTTGERPARQPEVKMTNENWTEGQDVEVSVSYETMPEIPEVDFSAVKLERMVVTPEESEVQEALSRLAENAKTFEAKKKTAAAKDGDQVVIDFKGSIDGVPFDGGAAEDFPLVLGSGQFIPGFEDQLVGVKAGEEKDVTVTFPENYGAAQLAGKDAVFAVTVKEVRGPKAAEIDDELAKKFGAEDLEDLRKQLTERLSVEYRQAARLVMKRALLDDLSERTSFELPPSLVEAEASQIAHQLWHSENPDHHGHDHGEIETTEEHRKLAERRVRLGLLLAEVGNKNGIQVTEQEMTQAVYQQARQYGNQAQQFVEFVQKNPQVQQQISAPIFEDKVVDYVFSLASVSDRDVSKDDLQKAVEALEEA